MNRDPFKEYIKQSEPDRRSRGYAWHTAIGLQAVDGLKPSKYLIDTAIQNIEGNITIEEAQKIIDSYYEAKPRAFDEDRTEEADKVSARIAGLLAEKAFSFSSNEYIGIHRKLFQGIYNHAGKIRDYNITKKEWVLDGATVLYGSASELRATLEYDLELEKNFSYKGLSMDDIIRHLAVFISRLWQIHIFGEGNTRATAVFFIKYLRNLGFDATNDIFAENAWYFRKALVRANYNNLKEGIYETTEYLETFLRNLLLDEQNELSNRKLHIYVKSANQKPDIRRQNPDIDGQNPDIEASKATIDLPEQFQMILESFSKRTISHVQKLYENYGSQTVFGRSDVVELLGIQKSSSSELLKKMLQSGIIVKVSGYGKGKYRFTGI